MSCGLRNKIAARSRGVRRVSEELPVIPEFMARTADDYDGGEWLAS